MILKHSRATISTKRLSWNGKTKTFAAELSDLHDGFGMERVYDDACDIGLTLHNPDTGKEVTFYLAHEERSNDEDNELRWYEFAVIPEHVRKNRNLDGVKVILFND